MGFVSLSCLGVLLTTSYYTRLDKQSGVDLWGWLMVQTPEDWHDILIRNCVLFVALYLPIYYLLYLSPLKSLFHSYKLNKRYPPASMVLKEAIRSTRGVLIASAMETLVHSLTRRNIFPLMSPPQFLNVSENRSEVSVVPLLLVLLLGYLWGDCHFYWTHRLLHIKQLYARIHKVHHESFNPNPFSGLSMHPIESAVYFSSAFMLSFVVPIWVARLMFIGLIILPLEGHAGFGSWNHEETVNHYLHHSKFEWNYGSSPLWDKLMGTDLKLQTDRTEQSTPAEQARERAAIESALLAGSALGKGIEGEALEKECIKNK